MGILPQPAYGQDKLDSLKNALQLAKADTVRFERAMDLAKYYRRKKPAEGQKYIDQAHNIAVSLDDSSLIARVMGQQAINYGILGKLDKSIASFKQSIAIFKQMDSQKNLRKGQLNLAFTYMIIGKNKDARKTLQEVLEETNQNTQNSVLLLDRANALNVLGSLENRQGNPRKALNYDRRSLSITESLDDHDLLANDYINVGNDYSDIGLYDSTLTYYHKALKIREQMGDSVNIGVTLHNIGDVNGRIENYSRAIDYFHQSLKIHQRLGMNQMIARDYHGIGDIYNNTGKIDSSLIYYRKAVDIFSDVGDRMSTAQLQQNIAQLLVARGYLSEADAHLQKAEALNRKLDSDQVGSQILLTKANLYNQRKQYHKAIGILNNTITKAKSGSMVELIREAYQAKAKTFARLGQYQEAYNAYKRFKAYDDSLLNKDKEQTFLKLETRYQVNKKQKENELLHKESQRQKAELIAQTYRNYMLGGGLLAFVIIASVLGWSWNRQKKDNAILKLKNKQITDQARRLDKKNEKLKEMDAFKNNMMHMIVHDLKNPLTVVMGMSDNEHIKRSGQHMLSMVNNILEIEKLEEAKLESEIETISLISLLSKVQKQFAPFLKINNQSLETTVENDIQLKGDRHLTYRILENLLSNASKYSPLGSKIKVRAEEREKDVRIEVEDRGKGIPKDQQEYIFNQYWMGNSNNRDISTGLGLAFCKMAVEAQGGDIRVESQEGQGSVFWMTLPKPDF